jgi:hypothetical protein
MKSLGIIYKLESWCAFSVQRIVGPVVFDETVNSKCNITPIITPFCNGTDKRRDR